MLIFSLGGELDTAFVLPGIFSDGFPPPSTSADGLCISFPDGATLHYEAESGELRADGIKTVVINASESVNVTAPTIACATSVKILLATPEVECTHNLTIATLNVKKGGRISGEIEHFGGQCSSNGVVIDAHDHGQVQCGQLRLNELAPHVSNMKTRKNQLSALLIRDVENKSTAQRGRITA
ncbi:phage baseplate assembly protein V [Yersinia alsatica]|uniref:phage baseplate assembly protein V n=1 Tax=Yersinia alsatica TaxID=2890317 RepID=UPI003D9A6173